MLFMAGVRLGVEIGSRAKGGNGRASRYRENHRLPDQHRDHTGSRSGHTALGAISG